jgi:hypothetical protein
MDKLAAREDAPSRAAFERYFRESKRASDTHSGKKGLRALASYLQGKRLQ